MVADGSHLGYSHCDVNLPGWAFHASVGPCEMIRVTSAALLTDRYELTMLDAALNSGAAERHTVFEVYARRLPGGRRYGVFAGIDRFLAYLAEFRFTQRELDWLADAHVVSDATLDYLANFTFTGEIVAYREGELYFPNSPVVTVVAPFGEAVVLETLLLSVLNHDSAIATAAARMVNTASGRTLVDFGARRTHEQAAVAAARAAYIAGFAGTSNLEAGATYGIPTVGTSAHAFTLLFANEQDAFAAQIEMLGANTTLLVDTFDVPTGVRNAVLAGGSALGAIRIDSGDLYANTTTARRVLDEAGATDTRIVVSGDLDEFKIASLAAAPIDSFGIGTRLVTGSGQPTAEFVYKMVARQLAPHLPLTPVAKGGGAKATVGGRKRAARQFNDGVAVAEVLHPFDATLGADEQPLQHPVVTQGVARAPEPLAALRSHHQQAVATLPAAAFALAKGDPCLPTLDRMSPSLSAV